jgi:hypothetical protein
MRGVSADVGWFFSFPGRESKANDQNSKNVPSRATRPTFATESHQEQTLVGAHRNGRFVPQAVVSGSSNTILT